MDEFDQQTLRDLKKYTKREDIKREFRRRYASLEDFPSVEHPVTTFLAGAPGVGKTEFSLRALKSISEYTVFLDPDKIRTELPNYDGAKSLIFQKAVSSLMDTIYAEAIRNNQNIIVDGTFANYRVCRENIAASVNKKRAVDIYYIFRDPYTNWGIVKKREQLDKRNIPKIEFIDAFYSALENVNKVKEEFGDQVKVYKIVKSDEFKYEIELVTKLDPNLTLQYNREALERELYD